MHTLPAFSFNPWTLVVSLVGLGMLNAEDVTTKDGKTFTNIKIAGEDTESVKITHDQGIAKIPKKNLALDFLQKHELTPAPTSTDDKVQDASVSLLRDFKVKYPNFITKDGREFQSSQIVELEPSGLKLSVASGLVRVKFSDLSEKYKTALGYDPLKVAEFERKQTEERQHALQREQQAANAASSVDGGSVTVRLQLTQNVGRGWVCEAEARGEVEQDVDTLRQGNRLAGEASVVVETAKKKVMGTVGTLGRIMVFGLPLYGSSGVTAEAGKPNVWEGKIYPIGKYRGKTVLNGGTEMIAFHIDRGEALKFVENNGVGRDLTPQGTVESDPNAQMQVTGSGTGFGINHDGYIATAAHVVDGASEIRAYVGAKSVPAKLVAVDLKNDVAIIKVNEPTSHLIVQPTTGLTLGADLFTVGFPLITELGTNPRLTKGSVSALSGANDETSAIQISVQIQPGNSGGPVCTSDGRVIGVVRSTISTLGSGLRQNAIPQNVNFASKSDVLLALTKSVDGLTLPPSTASTRTEQDEVLKAIYLISVSKRE